MKAVLNKLLYKNKFKAARLTDVNLDGLRIVISFSLYGNVHKYFGGLVENCKTINTIYPNFWIYVYLGNDFDRSIMEGKFDAIKNIVFIETGKSGHEVMSYRFFAIDRPEVGIAFSRDADSRINARDQYCINEFLRSSKKFQIIRDNPSHGVQILGGMWGIKKGLELNIEYDLNIFRRNHIFQHGTDQDFLAEYIYPKVRDHALIFDEYFNYPGEIRHKIVNNTNDKEFIGAPVYLYIK